MAVGTTECWQQHGLKIQLVYYCGHRWMTRILAMLASSQIVKMCQARPHQDLHQALTHVLVN